MVILLLFLYSLCFSICVYFMFRFFWDTGIVLVLQLNCMFKFDAPLPTFSLWQASTKLFFFWHFAFNLHEFMSLVPEQAAKFFVLLAYIFSFPWQFFFSWWTYIFGKLHVIMKYGFYFNEDLRVNIIYESQVSCYARTVPAIRYPITWSG